MKTEFRRDIMAMPQGAGNTATASKHNPLSEEQVMSTNNVLPTAKHFKNLTGKKFGILTVAEFAGVKNKQSRWKCSCRCGGEIIAFATNLKRGYPTSCGCETSKRLRQATTRSNQVRAEKLIAERNCPDGSIKLNDGSICFVDPSDFHLVRGYVWHLHKGQSGSAYARTTTAAGHLFMHTIIMGTRAEHRPDHIDGNGLNNRRSNLRWATSAQNTYNRRMKPSRSGFRGVTHMSRSTRFAAAIQAKGINYYLGSFDTAEDAARTYDQAAIHHHGEFAKLNFPESSV